MITERGRTPERFLRCWAGYPLFEEQKKLDVIIEMPMKTIVNAAEDRPEVPGVLRYTDADQLRIQSG